MGKLIDLTGQEFGILTVLNRAPSKQRKTYWHCRCRCGNEIDVESGNLRMGRTKSCGCQRGKSIGDSITKDITGQKFGKLTVLEKTNDRICGAIVWKCQCDCGNITYVPTGNLQSNHTMSCGCKKISHGEIKIAQLLIKNNIPFETQKTFSDCISPIGYPLRFDFYVNKKYIIEYDGEQHFDVISSSWSTKEQVKKTQLYDKIKNEWCERNNVPIIRIPYTKLKNLTIQDITLTEV